MNRPGDVFDVSVLQKCKRHTNVFYPIATQPMRITLVCWMDHTEGCHEDGDTYFGGGYWVKSAGEQKPLEVAEGCPSCGAVAR